MPQIITEDGTVIPSREFLSMVIIMLRKAKKETGDDSLVGWLESLEDKDPDGRVDAYEDDTLRTAVYKILKENYLDKEKQDA